jgi:CheY-like chemotaxis protein
VQADSAGLGKGSTFTVRLPSAGRHDAPEPASAATTQAREAANAAASGAGRRVLIVDDNIDAAETLAMMLELLGHTTSQAHDGHEALRVAKEFQPQVVFMDIGLPGLSGHQAVSRMRRDLGMSDTYIVALSGYGTEEDRRKSAEAGFDHHIVKPLDPCALPAILGDADRRESALGQNVMMAR